MSLAVHNSYREDGAIIMEQTSSIDALPKEDAQVAETNTQTINKRIHLSTCIYLMQIVCCFLQVRAMTTNGLNWQVSALAILTSVAGIAAGVFIGHTKSARSGLNCTAVNTAALLLWTMQIVFRAVPF